MRSKTIRVLALIIVLAMIASPVSGLRLNTVEAQGGLPGRNDLVPTGHTPVEKYSLVEADDVVDLAEISRYIVLFEGASLSRAKGGVGINSIEGQNYLNSLAVNRQSVLSKAENLLGRSIEVRYIYDVVLNGVSVELSAQEAKNLEGMPGIRKVLKDRDYTLDTDAGPKWIGADGIWTGSAVPDALGTKGEGVLVGILDSGINFDHPSFSDTPADGYVYTWAGDYLGVCASTGGDPDYASACNDKLVGAWSYTHDAPSETVTPEDSDGHGSHTASTVAGNTVDVEFFGVPVTISGVAPHAQIIAYDVCYPTPSGGQCAGDDSVAAVQQAILDGVDVINYSISGGEDPYNDAVELAFLDATAAGITVSTSAGNSGPDAGTVAHRSPWVLSTAATSHNRKFTHTVDFSNSLYQGITTLAGEIPFTTAVVDKAVKYSGEDLGNEFGCNAYPAGFFTDSIALVKRGSCTFTEKINNAADAGAVGVLIFTNTNPPGAMSVSGTTIPGVMLDIPGTTGDAIAAWVGSAMDDTVSISAFGDLHSNAYADIMANFSSRGPNNTFDVLKPDIAAPGLEILAAVADGTIAPSPEYEVELLQGTSMASPHDAGAAALLKALHPTWSASRIKSALMLTAYDYLLKEDKTTAADPFDIGAGRVQLELAGLTGLVMDETIGNYEAADPALGGDVKSLNIASVYNSTCVGECSWTRTFTSVADMPATYTVNAPAWITVAPSSFTINPGATQKITITADVSAYEPGDWIFGNIEFLTDSTFAGGAPVVLLSEGFESTTFPPTGWQVFDMDGVSPNWARTTLYKHTGSAGAWHLYSNPGEDQDGWLVSPAITLTGGELFSFWEQTRYPTWYMYHGLWISEGSSNPADGDYVELAEFDNPTTAWAQHTVPLGAYSGKTVYLAFRYQGDDADAWVVDDIALTSVPTGKPISDVAIPAAVLPAAGNLPALAKFVTHRDTGGDTLEDLLAVEITELTVDKYGWVKGEKNQIQLAEDPTNSDPYDNLSQVWYTVVPLDEGAARLVAEITATTALDLDLYWGFDLNGDGKPQENEEYGHSATATAFEYLTEWGFPAPFYDVWIMVQNWRGSGAALDDITLTIGHVPYAPVSPENMTVDGPASNPAEAPFSMDIYWHDMDTEEGDRLYGMIDVYADADYDVWIGISQLDVIREKDDVVKTADVTSAEPGDTITYTIEITNYTPNALVYDINDVLPAGVTYVPGSVTGGAVYDAGTNAIQWSGTVQSGGYDYAMTTSIDNPVCAMPLANSGAYVDLEEFGILTQAGVSGEGTWQVATSGSAIEFYGQNSGNNIRITEDGYVYLEEFSPKPAANADIPNPASPNNLIAMLWRDMVAVYDSATNKGLSLANLTSGGAPVGHVIEWDDVYVKGQPTQTYDIEMYIQKAVDNTPGEYEVVIAYDNITGPKDIGTIGVENSTGTKGVKFAYNDAALGDLSNGMAICFDWVLMSAVKTITFQVTVDEGSADLLTNVALHENNQMGTVEERAIAVVQLPASIKNIYVPLLFK